MYLRTDHVLLWTDRLSISVIQLRILLYCLCRYLQTFFITFQTRCLYSYISDSCHSLVVKQKLKTTVQTWPQRFYLSMWRFRMSRWLIRTAAMTPHPPSSLGGQDQSRFVCWSPDPKRVKNMVQWFQTSGACAYMWCVQGCGVSQLIEKTEILLWWEGISSYLCKEGNQTYK